MKSATLVAAALTLLAAAACSKTPAPVPTTPAPASAAAPQPSAAQAATDSAARAAAHRDSLAAAVRADSLARAEQERAQADSVRAQVQRATVDTVTRAAPAAGLSAADSAALEEAVHFDYDKADLQPADLPRLDRKLQLLEAHPRLEIQVAGHCDERGSDEYNLALGERRAAAAKRYLEAHGIAGERIGIVSYGKERPIDPGHTEEAWARNRRDDFSVTRGAN
jgi:peptidoglycan-associated lipoprotein